MIALALEVGLGVVLWTVAWWWVRHLDAVYDLEALQPSVEPETAAQIALVDRLMLAQIKARDSHE